LQDGIVTVKDLIIFGQRNNCKTVDHALALVFSEGPTLEDETAFLSTLDAELLTTEAGGNLTLEFISKKYLHN